jgi:hypothetical protein
MGQSWDQVPRATEAWRVGGQGNGWEEEEGGDALGAMELGPGGAWH